MNKNQIEFNIEFCSNSRIDGWISDKSSLGLLDLRSDCGKVARIDNSFSVDKCHINQQISLQNKTRIDFSINLRDLFNGMVHDYDLYINNIKLWSFSDSLQDLDNIKLAADLPILQEKNFGSKQVVVVYQENSFLHNILGRIHCWNKNFFHKKYHSGVSFIFIPISSLADVKNNLLEQNNQIIMIIEQSIIKNAFTLSPSLISRCNHNNNIIIIEKQLNFNTAWNGLLSVVSSCANINNNDFLIASEFLKMLMMLSNYADLFFDATTSFYSYQSGQVKEWMKEVIRHNIQSQINEDVVIVSNIKINRLKQVNQNDCAIFVRTSSLRFLLDIIPLNSIDFIKESYRRGARIRVVQEELL